MKRKTNQSNLIKEKHMTKKFKKREQTIKSLIKKFKAEEKKETKTFQISAFFSFDFKF